MSEDIFSGIKGIIWDLDNTLYKIDDVLAHAFDLSVARAAIADGLAMPIEQATTIATKSFKEYGYNGHIFVNEHDADHDHLHFEAQHYLDETIIEKSRKVKELFSEINLPNILVTHSPLSWAERVLEHLELKEFFPDDYIFPFERYDFKPKSEDGKVFERSLEKLSISGSEAVVIEDMIPNLRIPHDIGINTILVHHGKKIDPIPDFVAYSCSNVLEVLQKIKTAQNNSQGYSSNASG